jgi:hypothetical protein
MKGGKPTCVLGQFTVYWVSLLRTWSVYCVLGQFTVYWVSLLCTGSVYCVLGQFTVYWVSLPSVSDTICVSTPGQSSHFTSFKDVSVKHFHVSLPRWADHSLFFGT